LRGQRIINSPDWSFSSLKEYLRHSEPCFKKNIKKEKVAPIACTPIWLSHVAASVKHIYYNQKSKPQKQ